MNDITHALLYNELAAAVDQARKVKIEFPNISLLDALRSENRTLSAHATLQLYKLGEALNDIIKADPRFPGEQVKFLRTYNGSSQIYPHDIGRTMLGYILRENTVEDAIEWMLKVLNTRSASGSIILSLWGVPVAEEIQLTPNVRIFPLESLPDTPQKRLLESLPIKMMEAPHGGSLGYKAPESALLMTAVIDPVIVSGEEIENVSRLTDFQKAQDDIFEIALVLTAIGPRVSLTSAQWFSFDDLDLNDASTISGAYSWKPIEIMPFWQRDFPTLDPVEAPQLVQRYLGLPDNVRRQVRVALERLNQAQRRVNVGDQAVELSIAFESLLGDSQAEMTHKIKIRAVRLLGGNEEVRIANTKIIGKTYDIRSKLVHSGTVDLKKQYSIGDQHMSRVQTHSGSGA